MINKYLIERFASLERQKFGTGTVRHLVENPEQLALALDAEAVRKEEVQTEQISYT